LVDVGVPVGVSVGAMLGPLVSGALVGAKALADALALTAGSEGEPDTPTEGARLAPLGTDDGAETDAHPITASESERVARPARHRPSIGQLLPLKVTIGAAD
jgi:hypothetical protein